MQDQKHCNFKDVKNDVCAYIYVIHIYIYREVYCPDVKRKGIQKK